MGPNVEPLAEKGSRGSGAEPPVARATVILWIVAALLAVGMGAVATYQPLAIVFAAAAAGASALVIVAFSEPRWVLLAHLFLVLTYAPIILSSNFGVPVTLQSLVFLLLIGVIVRAAVGAERPPLTREVAGLVVLLGAMLVSLAFAQDRVRGVSRVSDFVSVALMAFLILTLVDDVRWLRRSMWAFTGGIGFLGALAVLQQLTHTYSFDYFGFATIAEGDRDLARSAGPTDPNFFAQLLLVSAVFAVYLGFASRRLPVRALAAGIAVTSAAAMLFTYSRGALLATAAVLVVAAILRKVRASILLGVGAAVLATAVIVLPTDAKQRFLDIVSPGSSGIAHSSDSSVANRFAENLAAIHMLRDYPLIGVGPGNYSARYKEYSQQIGLDTRAEERPGVEQAAHSLYLEALSELGVLGAGVFFAIIVLAFLGALRARSQLSGGDRLMAEGLFVGLAGYFTSSLFLHAAYLHFLWIVLALGLAAGRIARQRAETVA